MAFQLLGPAVGAALEVGGEGGVDVAVVHGPDEQRRHEAAVLADLVDHVVAGAGEEDVLVDARRLVGPADAGEEVLVRLGFPGPEPRARSGAGRAALLAVDAVVEAELLLEVERLVGARRVLVADDVVRAGDHAAGAPRAEPGGDDLVVELLPLERPALLVAGRQGVGTGGGRASRLLGDRHVPTLPMPGFGHGSDLPHRGRGVPNRDPRVVGGEPSGRLVRRGLRDDAGGARRVQPGVGSEALLRRVDLRDVADGVRRQGPVAHAGRGAGRGVRSGQGAAAGGLLRRHPGGAHDPPVGERGAEAGVPAADHAGHRALVPGLQRARLRLRPGVPQDERGARRERVGDQRPEGVDHPGAVRRLLLPARPHGSPRRQARRHLVPVGADEAAGRRGAADHATRRHRRVQRGVLRRRALSRRQRGGRAEQRLGGHQHHVGLRARAVGHHRLPPLPRRVAHDGRRRRHGPEPSTTR